jgi:hypothetical protein
MATPPPVPRELVDGLQATGAALVRALWVDYEFTPATVPLLRLAAEQADRLAVTRAALAAQSLMVKSRLHPLLIVEQRALRNLMDLFRQMHLEPSAS